MISPDEGLMLIAFKDKKLVTTDVMEQLWKLFKDNKYTPCDMVMITDTPVADAVRETIVKAKGVLTPPTGSKHRVQTAAPYIPMDIVYTLKIAEVINKLCSHPVVKLTDRADQPLTDEGKALLVGELTKGRNKTY